ncbi:MAG: PD-(D/E)XK nuclease family protein, partial [Pseudomonadota bacterium]
GDVTLKREMEKGTDEVRVMTIHGAKGLEAPVVILPDTVDRAAGSARPVLLPNDPGAENSLIIWAGKTETDDRATTAARTIAKAREEAEAKRLLYVGLTRAEDWLILCGAGKRQDADKSWYGRLEAAAVAFGGQPDVAPDGLDGVLTRIGPALPETSPAGPSSAAQVFDEHVRDPWISRAPREARLRRIAPSSLAPKGGRSAHGNLEDPEQARVRGLAVHALLERLPEVPDGHRETQVDQILAEFIPHLPDALIAEVRIEAEAVLNERSFADIFGPDSLGETLVTIPIAEPGFVPMQGRIDRLLVQPGRVLIVDFKTDQHAARTMDETPLSYRAQLGAYLSAIKAIYPDRLVEAGLLWTRTRELLVFPGPDLEDTYSEALASATGIDLASAHT